MGNGMAELIFVSEKKKAFLYFPDQHKWAKNSVSAMSRDLQSHKWKVTFVFFPLDFLILILSEFQINSERISVEKKYDTYK